MKIIFIFFFFDRYVDLESQMTSFERLRFYATKLPQEKENIEV
jgi:hypothetical protein